MASATSTPDPRLSEATGSWSPVQLAVTRCLERIQRGFLTFGLDKTLFRTGKHGTIPTVLPLRRTAIIPERGAIPVVMAVRTRFAPSPTGYLHIGGARTALFSWLHARQNQGVFVLRIEDTDQERSTPEAVEAILEGLRWLQLDWDEGPFFQSQRSARYHEVIHQLLAAGHAYHCYCTKAELDRMREEQRARGDKPKYNGHCRHRAEPRPGIDPVVRFRAPDAGETVVNDLIHGTVRFDNTELDDLIIARSDGSPTYNLTVVVDDWDMAITDIIRGDDHLNNTPRQIQLMEAFGADLPRYAHVPMILGEDRKRLSKRHGAVSVLQYRDEGYLPEALLNGLARLGWSYGDEEIFDRKRLLERFAITEVGRMAATFNTNKLLWLNGYYIRASRPEELVDPFRQQLERHGVELCQGPDLVRLIQIQQERAKTLAEMADNSLFFFRDFGDYASGAAQKHLIPKIAEPLQAAREAFTTLESWTEACIYEAIQRVAEHFGLKFGKLAQPIRVAVSGRASSPPIDATLQLLGKTTTLARLDRALSYIQAQQEAGEST